MIFSRTPEAGLEVMCEREIKQLTNCFVHKLAVEDISWGSCLPRGKSIRVFAANCCRGAKAAIKQVLRKCDYSQMERSPILRQKMSGG